MQINLDPKSITNALQGNKTYITLAVGAAVIALNHFGYLPDSLVPQGLDSNNWINDEYKLIVGAVFRSAIAKAETPASSEGPKYGSDGALVK